MGRVMAQWLLFGAKRSELKRVLMSCETTPGSLTMCMRMRSTVGLLRFRLRKRNEARWSTVLEQSPVTCASVTVRGKSGLRMRCGETSISASNEKTQPRK